MTYLLIFKLCLATPGMAMCVPAQIVEQQFAAEKRCVQAGELMRGKLEAEDIYMTFRCERKPWRETASPANGTDHHPELRQSFGG